MRRLKSESWNCSRDFLLTKVLRFTVKIRLCVGNGIGPVSYTHLDVYKRQTAITVTYNDDSSECESTTTLCNLSYTVDSNQAILKSVSYTHLFQRLVLRISTIRSTSQ